MAGFDFSSIDLSDPFGGTARQGSLMNSVFGQPTIASQASASTAAFQQRVLERMREGNAPFPKVLLDELSTPEGQAALTQPGFLQAMKELQEAVAKPKQEFGTVSAGASVFDKETGKLGAQAPSTPSAAEKIVDAILEAPKGSEKRKLLTRGLTGTDGLLNVKDYLTLVSAGAKPDPELIPKAVTAEVTPKRAGEILALGTASGPRAPNGVDMFMAALGIQVPGSPLNSLTREEGQQLMLIREELAKQSGKPDLATQVLQSMAGGAVPGGSNSGGGGLQELFEKLNQTVPEGPGPAPVSAAAPGEVPVFGSGPKAGGTGGQASGPSTGTPPMRPEQIKAVEAMPPENFGELSPETLKAIVNAVVSGTLKLSEEQKAALLAANGARLGSAN